MLFRRDWPYFLAFDLLTVDGEGLMFHPLVGKTHRLRRILSRVESRLLYVDHVEARGVDLFREAAGAISKHRRERKCGPHYTGKQRTSWLKIWNPEYSQFENRRDMFAPRRSAWSRPGARPVLCPELAGVQRWQRPRQRLRCCTSNPAIPLTSSTTVAGSGVGLGVAAFPEIVKNVSPSNSKLLSPPSDCL